MIVSVTKLWISCTKIGRVRQELPVLVKAWKALHGNVKEVKFRGDFPNDARAWHVTDFLLMTLIPLHPSMFRPIYKNPLPL